MTTGKIKSDWHVFLRFDPLFHPRRACPGEGGNPAESSILKPDQYISTGTMWNIANPLFAVECKLSDPVFSKAVKYFKERTKIPEFYQVHLSHKDVGRADVTGRSLPFWKFCQIKQMP